MIFDRIETFQEALNHFFKYLGTTNRDRFFNFPQYTLLLTNIKIVRHIDQTRMEFSDWCDVTYFFIYKSQKYTLKTILPNGQIRKFLLYSGRVFKTLELLESQLRKSPVYPILIQ